MVPKPLINHRLKPPHQQDLPVHARRPCRQCFKAACRDAEADGEHRDDHIRDAPVLDSHARGDIRHQPLQARRIFCPIPERQDVARRCSMKAARINGREPGITEQIVRDGDDPPLCPGPEIEGVDATARHADQSRRRHVHLNTVQPHLRMAIGHHQDLEQALMRMRRNDPIIQRRSRGDVFNVQEFGSNGCVPFPVKRKSRDVLPGHVHVPHNMGLIEKCNSLSQSCLAFWRPLPQGMDKQAD